MLARGLTILALCAVITAASPAAAQPMQRQQCLPFNEMIAAMRAEGQRTLLQGDKVALGDGLPLMIWSSNDDGSRGYELTGNRRPGQAQPDRLCVMDVLTNVRLHNANARTVPASFRLSVTMSRSEVERASAQTGYGSSADHNTSLDAGARSGFYPALQGSVEGRPGLLLTIGINPDTGAGNTVLTRADGFSVRMMVLRDLSYSTHAAQLFRSGQ